MTATITALYAALDEDGANVPMILSQLADAYEDAGDEVRGRVIRWCWRKDKRPFAYLVGWWRWRWLAGRGTLMANALLPGRAAGLSNFRYSASVPENSRSAAFRALADACAEWVERRRGRA